MSRSTRARPSPTPSQSSRSSSPQSPPSLLDGGDESSSMLDSTEVEQSNQPSVQQSINQTDSLLDLTSSPTHSNVDTGRLTKVTDVRSTDAQSQSSNQSSKFDQLDALLSQTAVYSSFLAERMPNRYQHSMKLFESSADRRGAAKSSDKQSNNSTGLDGNGDASVSDERMQALQALLAPKDRQLFMYQAVGVDWLISLFENGLNGILADEMGLGKTVQIITFLAHLSSKNVRGTVIVCAPLTTLDSWMNEFATWCPQLSVIKFWAQKDDRKQLQAKVTEMVQNQAKKSTKQSSSLSVIVTSYQIALNDVSFLKKFNYKLMIVDEGHRLKSNSSKLLKALKEYPTENRILLTGTPLQNNLKELWNLMNFLLPSVFDSLSKFEKWFDFDSTQVPTMNFDENAESRSYAAIFEAEKSARLVSKLHSILHPFVLRRLKIDVLKDTMPSKREWLIYCPMTDQQRMLYEEIMSTKLETLTTGVAGLNMNNVFIQLQKVCNSCFMVRSPPWMDSDKLVDFIVDDDEEALKLEDERVAAIEADAEETGKSATVTARRRKRSAKAMNLPPPKKTRMIETVQAIAMSNDEIMQQLFDASSKMQVVELVLKQLKSTGGKVLIFSQYLFTLDLLEELVAAGGYGPTIRIDGNTPSNDRTSQVKAFNLKTEDSPSIALLSTRAAGLGLNLQTASNVILFDSDWNPQIDLQAQDRAHRVGSKDDVVVMRLLTPGTLEMKRFRRADEKKVLTNVVMARNRFKGVENAPRSRNNQDIAEKLKNDAIDADGDAGDAQDFLTELQQMLAVEGVKGIKAKVAANHNETSTESSSSSSEPAKKGSHKQQLASAAAKARLSVGVSEEEVDMLLTGKMNSTNVISHPFIELADEWLTDLNPSNV